MFKVLDEEDILAKQIIPCLANLSKKCKFYCEHCQKTHHFVKKIKKVGLRTNPDDLEQLTS